MFKAFLSLTAAVAIMAISVAAHALSVTNLDSSVYTLSILEEDDEWSADIEPGETLKYLCNSPCSIALGRDKEWDFEGHENLKLMNGRLIFVPH